MYEKPLVSVVVVSYNSSGTIIETLNSIKNQTYSNIEIVITDDCSVDNTIELVESWLYENSGRFVNSVIIKSQKNTGLAANLNRGIYKISGTWTKIIAGDDLLLPKCIETYIKYVSKEKNAKVVFSRVRAFGDEKTCEKFNEWCEYGFFNLSQYEKKLYILTENKITAPTLFIKSNIFTTIGSYDESMPFIDDWPFWIKLLTRGIDFSFINKETVLYRTSASSLGAGGSKKFEESVFLVKAYAYRKQMELNPIYKIYAYACDKQKKAPNKVLKRLFGIIIRLSPYYYYYKHIRGKIEQESIKLNLSIVPEENK